MVTGPISKTKPPTHSNRPALSVRRLDKRRTGCRCTTTPLLRHIQLAAGIYPMTWRMRGSCSAVKSPLDWSNGRLDMAPGHRCNRLGALYPRTPMVPAAHRSEICRSVVGRSLETQRCLPPIRPPNQDLHLRNQAHRSGPSISWSADKSLYTGITNDMERRLDAHRTGKGAIYTKTRSPLLLRYTEYHDSKGSALSREAAIKSLTRSAKLALIAAQPRPAQVNK